MTSTLFSRGVRTWILLLSIATAVPGAFGQSPKSSAAPRSASPATASWRISLILSYSDLEGWDQAAEFRVSKDGKHAYISNYQGFSVVDVSDPARPRVVSQIKNDKSVQSQYIDVLGNLLVVNQEGVRSDDVKTWTSEFVFSTSPTRPSPRKSAFLKPTWLPTAACTAFGFTKIRSKASSHSLRPPCRVTSARS